MRALAIFVTLAAVAAAQPKKPAAPDALATEIREQAKKIKQLESQVSELKSALDLLDKFAENINSDVYDLKRNSASFDPSSPNDYTRVQTEVGPLLLSLGKVEPYLDGYKVSLEIGNIMSCTFQGFKLVATWAPRYRGNPDSFGAWLKSRRIKEFAFTNSLLPNRWNIIELILPDTKPDAFGYLEVSVILDRVRMQRESY